MSLVQHHLAKLGHRVRDKVTGLEGILTTVAFDLYGCIQVAIHPGLDKDGKLRDCHYHDISRIQVLSEDPVMDQPDFVEGEVAEGLKGPAEKPKAKQ